MSNIDKRALREAAVRAGGVKWQYMRATQHTKAYLTDEKGWTVVNCTDGDVPAKCAGFIESANPATVLALLDELEAAEKRIAELEAREVLLPPKAPDNLASCLGGYEKWLIATTFRDTWNACLAEVVRVNAAAGKGE